MFIQFLKKINSMNRIFVIFLCMILILTSCTTNKEVKKQGKNPSFEYLNVFGGALFDILKGVFPLKDGTFYIVAETHSPASIGDIPKSCHFKLNDLRKMSDIRMQLECVGDIWIFQIDPRKEEGKQIVYSRCFGGTGLESVKSVFLTEDEQIVVVAFSFSNDGDLSNEPVKGDKRWIFRVDPKKKWNEQITYSNSFDSSIVDEVHDIKFVSKDIAYIYSSRKSNTGNFYNLQAIDFSKDGYNSQIFNRDIFFTDFNVIKDLPWFAKNKMVIGDNGIIHVVISVDKDHLFMPKDKNKPLNINRTISYKENKVKDEKERRIGAYSDILFLSLDPKLSESDWIVFSRFIGGNNCESIPSILQAKDGKYWISFVSSSCDGELKGVKFKCKDENDNYCNLVLLKLNPNLAFDKQIEYLKYFSTVNKDEHLRFYCFAKDENDNIAFLADRREVRYIDGDNNETAVLDNKTFDKEKNVQLPSLKDKTYNFNKNFEIFYLDTKKDEVFYKDLYIISDAFYCLGFLDTSSLYFAMSNYNKPNVGDMPNYKMSALEDLVNRESYLENESLNSLIIRSVTSPDIDYSEKNYNWNILVGILPIKNMKKLEK